MTMTEQTPRQNRHGGVCPPWCRTDHEKYYAHVGSGGGIDSIWVRAARGRGEPRVSVSAALPDPAVAWPSLSLDPRGAEDLAVIVELLADVSPDAHRQLAAAIRQAAAAIRDTTTDPAEET